MAPEGYLWPILEQQPVLGTVTVLVPRRDDAPSREATLTIRTTPVSLKPPKHRGPAHLPNPTVTAVLAREENPPEDSAPIEWMLLTTLSVQTLADAATCLRWYSYRWRIERYHDVLKSGCQVEDLQLETRERLERAIAVYRLVAWRLLGLTYWARERSDEPCTTVLHPTEWYALYAAHTRTSDLPTRL